MTLDEMLALLPDNDSGEISAADLRAIVTSLATDPQILIQMFAYKWTNSTTNANSGQIGLNAGWSVNSTVLNISETTDNNLVLTFEIFETAITTRVRIIGAGGNMLRCLVTGPAVDQGTFRSIPVEVLQIVGTVPNVNVVSTVAVMLDVP